MKQALIVVDVQNDFCEGGSLAVAGGNRVAEDIAKFLDKNADLYDAVCFTKDWHSAYTNNGGHFSDTPDFVDTWPVHCVAGTTGASFHPAISEVYDNLNRPKWIFYKGWDRADYSGFEGFGRDLVEKQGSHELEIVKFSLESYLKKMEIDALTVVGIAGDYCVRQTALDAIDLGWRNTYLKSSLVVSVGGDFETNKTFAMLEAKAMS